jgi:hypothetical protein
MKTEIRIRAFRATDDSETCLKFILGHQKVLENHGIYNVTSSVVEWMYNPSVFVIVVESLDGTKLYGGARVHAADGIHPLPIETATSEMDSRVHDYVNMYARNGTGELCGLWNSIEVAGLGIGSYFPSRAAIVIIEQLGIQSLFFLCSPYTVRFNKWVGSRVFTEVGCDGTFYYPKMDLLATAVLLEDAKKLEGCNVKERDKIFAMRKNLTAVSIEKSPFKNFFVKINYELKIEGTDTNEFVLNKELFSNA